MRLKILAASVALAAMPGVASAQDAVATVDLNMRAGPNTGFPVVTTIPDGAGVGVFGCIRGYEWCDVAWAGRRGWVYAEYLAYGARHTPLIEIGSTLDVPVITFSFGDYWPAHYRGEPWYAERGRWQQRFRDAPWWADRGPGRDWDGDRDRRRGDWRDRDRGDARRGDWRDDDDNRWRRGNGRGDDDDREGRRGDRERDRGAWRANQFGDDDGNGRTAQPGNRPGKMGRNAQQDGEPAATVGRGPQRDRQPGDAADMPRGNPSGKTTGTGIEPGNRPDLMPKPQ